MTTIRAILLIVGGDLNSLGFVLGALNSQTPIIVVEGSGGVADLIAYAWRMLHDDE